MSELYTTEHCKEQIIAACLAIHTPYQTVKTLYQSKDATVIEYSRNGEKEEVMLDIKFDGATLIFLFDNSNICDKVCLFLDDSSYVTNYLEYCSKAYQYDYILKGWVNDGSVIKLQIEGNECNLIVFL